LTLFTNASMASEALVSARAPAMSSIAFAKFFMDAFAKTNTPTLSSILEAASFTIR
jgi:hypothetical protein